MRLWAWWEARCARQEDALALALVRILLPGVVAAALLVKAAKGTLFDHFRLAELGGLVGRHGDYAFVQELSPMWGGPVTSVICIVALLMVSAGVATRPALVVALVTHAQLGHLDPIGDRAIDRLARTVLLILLFSGAHQRLSLGRWLRGAAPAKEIPAWPMDLIRFILVLMYLSAGLEKLGCDPGWVVGGEHSPMYRILSDPMAGRLDPVAAEPWGLVFHAMGLFTVALELSSVLIFTRWMVWWAIGGVGMHLGIAALMHLGYFPWGMLALYPLLLMRRPSG